MKNLVRLESLTKNYGRFRALDEVSLSLDHGVIGLLGPNGAGKSTLIKALLGLVRTTRGTAEVLGHQLPRDDRSIRAKVGYMPEDDCYWSGFTGIDSVRFAGRLSGLPSVESLRRSHEVLDCCGIDEERYRTVDTYSAGMRQKVKFAQAIVHDPELVILDEPTSGLDPEEREAMLQHARTVFEFEFRRSLTRRRALLTLALAQFPVSLVALVQFQGAHLEREGRGDIALFFLIPVVLCVVGVLLWATSLIHTELDEKTWVYLALRPIGRGQILMGKYLSAAALSTATLVPRRRQFSSTADV